MNFFINDKLAEEPVNPAEFFDQIKELEDQEISDEFERGKLFSKIGAMYRIYGNPDKSEIFLNASLKLLKEDTNPLEYYTSKIRLAQTYQKQKKIDDSLELLEMIEKKCLTIEKLNALTDFVYQHKAKVYFDLENYAGALYYFKKALEIREIKKDVELIKSTVFAIEITLTKIK